MQAPLDQNALDEVAKCLCGGGVILMPTDTVYGVAALPSDTKAVSHVFKLKHRDSSKPLPLLAADVETVVNSGLVFPQSARKIAERFWPGPLTIILENPHGGTEAVRVPDDATAHAICKAAGGMVRCTSANESGEPPALDSATAANALPDADILIDGGPVKGGAASTIAQVTGSEVSILRPGPISLEELTACIKQDKPMPPKPAKIITAAEMRAERDRLHTKSKKLVFTNGCFDILHAGHITYLEFARAQGDALCIGINSDASVRRNKGDNRPIIDEQNRAKLLASLRFVDYVVIFDDNEPKGIIAEILPDVLVKGKDWAHYVSGRDVVEANGGKVVLADMVEGLSTSAIIAKIQKLGANDS